MMRRGFGGTTSKWSFALCCDRNDRYEDLPNGILAGGPKTPLTAPANSTSPPTASDQATLTTPTPHSTPEGFPNLTT